MVKIVEKVNLNVADFLCIVVCNIHMHWYKYMLIPSIFDLVVSSTNFVCIDLQQSSRDSL